MCTQVLPFESSVCTMFNTNFTLCISPCPKAEILDLDQSRPHRSNASYPRHCHDDYGAIGARPAFWPVICLSPIGDQGCLYLDSTPEGPESEHPQHGRIPGWKACSGDPLDAEAKIDGWVSDSEGRTSDRVIGRQGSPSCLLIPCISGSGS